MFDSAKAELANTNDGYGTWGPWKFGARDRKTAENYEKYRDMSNWDDDDDDQGVQFRPLNREDDDDDESGVQYSPPRSPVLPRHQVNNYHRNLSPTSRTQAIARGQKELMEMVKNMPETCYELSLKDLVEQPRVETNNTQEECLLQDKNYDDDDQQQQQQQVVAIAQQRVIIKRQESQRNETKKLTNKNMMRSGSMDNRGLFLKMVFPFSLNSSKKRHVNSSTACAKVSPKPEVSDRTSSKSVDKDWWKKRFSTGSSESDSSGRSSSNNNGSTGSSGSSSSHTSTSTIRKKGGFFSSCLPCFHFTKGKSAE